MNGNRGSKRVTLHDIAQRTGYSMTAVSRALRGKSDIGPEATAQIREAAREMGYVANQTAVSLRYGRSNIITLILAHMANPFFSVITDLLQIAAQEAGYSLMVFCSRGDAELELQQVREAIGRRVDGVLLFPTSQSGSSIELLHATGMPHVLLSANLEPGKTDCVTSDDEKGAYLAAMHLLEKGCHRLAFLSVNDDLPSYTPRREGFIRACDEAGLSEADRTCLCLPELAECSSSETSFDWRAAIEKKILPLKQEGYDGLFIYCDYDAWHIVNVLKSSEKLSTDDFGIIGFDNIDGALSSPTTLCSVDTSLGEIAKQSISLLQTRINGSDEPPQTVVCPVSIVCKGSCRVSGNPSEE